MKAQACDLGFHVVSWSPMACDLRFLGTSPLVFHTANTSFPTRGAHRRRSEAMRPGIDSAPQLLDATGLE